MADDVSLDELAELTASFTGADLAGLVREASLQSLQDSMETLDKSDSSEDDLKVNKANFEVALKNLRPSVNEKVHTSLSCARLISKPATYSISFILYCRTWPATKYCVANTCRTANKKIKTTYECLQLNRKTTEMKEDEMIESWKTNKQILLLM